MKVVEKNGKKHIIYYNYFDLFVINFMFNSKSWFETNQDFFFKHGLLKEKISFEDFRKKFGFTEGS